MDGSAPEPAFFVETPADPAAPMPRQTKRANKDNSRSRSAEGIAPAHRPLFPLTGGAGMSRPDRSRTKTAAATDKMIQESQGTSGGARPRSESEEAVAERMMELLRAGADVRARKVRRLRAAVRVKAYENQLKLSIAVDRMVRQTIEADPRESAA
jgi:hypothetical protein